jgi:arylsulfatase A-like enzyme
MRQPETGRPNIVCIMPDDTDFGWLGCYGGRTPTPNIDRIAANGACFTHMTCSASACTPSRYSYLTGQYAGRCSDEHFRAHNIDLAPTLFDIAGAPAHTSEVADGVSWLPLLKGQACGTRNWSDRQDLFFEFGYTRAVLWGKWKYIALRFPQHLIDAMASGELVEAPNHVNQRLQGQMNIAMEFYPSYFDPDQLYDLERDPDELHNLATDPAYAAVLATMKERLQRYLGTFDHPFALTVPDFMLTERYRELCDATRRIGTDHLSWWPKERWWQQS